jgi:hypothetical protein
MIRSVTALGFALAPLGVQPQANDAHHPGRSTKAKKTPGVKAKQTRKPPTKNDKTGAREVWPGFRTGNA